MRYNLFRHFLPDVLTQTADGGGSGAAGGDGAAGSGSSGASSGGGAPNGDAWSRGSSSQRGASAPVAYSDDLSITHEGKTMTMKEFIGSRYAPKEDVENAKKSTRQQIEQQIRDLAGKMAAARNQQPRQPQQAPQDPLAAFREMPIVGGKDMAAALEGTLGPVAQIVAQMQQKIAHQDQQLKKLGTGFGTLAKERGSKEREARVGAAITSLGEGYDPKDPFLADTAQDLLDAWEFEKPEEFPQMLAARVKAMEEFIKRKQQADLKRAKSRLFTRVGGNASPGGPARPDPRHMVKNVADILFGQNGQPRT